MPRHAVLIAATIACAFAQDKQEFDVASIKPTADTTNQFMLRIPVNGTFEATGVTLKMLIISAYQVNAYQISGGPSWSGTERWDIQAKAENLEGRMPREQYDRMLRALLESRFQLKARRETKDMPVYELVQVKGGSKLKPHTGDPGKPQERTRLGWGSLQFEQSKIAVLTYQLSLALGRTVIDKTGLTGEYDFTLEYPPEPGQGGPESIGLPPDPSLKPPSVDPNRPSIVTALQEQLGLRIDSRKGPVEMLIIEGVEKPSAN